jgi:sugar phosphate isomerase/epimerase
MLQLQDVDNSPEDNQRVGMGDHHHIRAFGVRADMGAGAVDWPKAFQLHRRAEMITR